MEPNPGPEPGPGLTRSTLRWLWLGAAGLMLLFPLRLWTKPVGRAMLASPAATPVDHGDPELAALWSFLARAAGHVPSGASYTLAADHPELEMKLYMLSLGLVRHAEPRPSSYYGEPLPEHGGKAEYVLAWGRSQAVPTGFELVAELGAGQVLRRAPEDP